MIGGSRSFVNEYQPHYASPGAVKDILKKHNLDDKLLLLNSGQSYDLKSETKFPNEEFYEHTYEDREKYLIELKTKKYDHEIVTFRDSVPLEKMLKLARQKMWFVQKKQNLYPKTILYIHVTDKDILYEVNFKKIYQSLMKTLV